jgi:hypothetical protein
VTTRRITAGRRLRRTLDKTLADGAEWDEGELVTLGLIEPAANRIEALKLLFETETGHPNPSAHKAAMLAGELRQTEASIAKLIASLDPNMEQQKSARHVAAANARWHRQHG